MQNKAIAISEIFGPTIQGEGMLIGKPTIFVRTGGCDYRCVWCLVPDTGIILLNREVKKISDIKIGDVLAGFDEQNGTLQSTTVTRIVVHESDDIWSIQIGNDKEEKQLVATGEHVWMTTSGWLATQDLQSGDLVYVLSQPQGIEELHYLPVREVSRLSPHQLQQVYDITCEPYPTFFANDILTHNCDTLYSVLPEHRLEWHSMTTQDIFTEVTQLSAKNPLLITLSGGNPAIQPLEALLDLGHLHGYTFALETQGSIFQSWFKKLDYLTLSPKPPSSKQVTHWERLDRCVSVANSFEGERTVNVCLKVVIFDEQDYAYARDISLRYPNIPLYLQVGNQYTHSAEPDFNDIRHRMDWLINKVVSDQWYRTTVLPQLHVFIWGNKRGV